MKDSFSDDDLIVAFKLDMPPQSYRTLLNRLTDTLAIDAGEQLPVDGHQHEEDRRMAEWILSVLYVAGYVPRRLAPLGEGSVAFSLKDRESVSA